MRVKDILLSTFSNNCPRCHAGRVFANNNPYSTRNGLTMLKHCPNCNLRYEKETGFFYGAMYVSYALVAGLFILLFALDALWLHLSPLVLFLAFSSLVIALFPVTFRWSRIIWIGLFTKRDKHLQDRIAGRVRNEEMAGEPR